MRCNKHLPVASKKNEKEGLFFFVFLVFFFVFAPFPALFA